VREDAYPIQWTGTQAVVTLPPHIDVSNAGKVREELLAVINRGATVLIADMTATGSCDHGGVDAVARAYQRATANGTQLRLVVAAHIVRRVLDANGLDRLISIYPSVAAAAAATSPGIVMPSAPRRGGAAGNDEASPGRPAQGLRRLRVLEPWKGPQAAVVTPAVMWRLVDALADGVALADGPGDLVLANRRLEDMFGYAHGELLGQAIETLIPADLRGAHAAYRAGYLKAPKTRPMGAGARLVGLRKDGSTFPAEISLSPVPTATGHFTMAVVRDITEVRHREDLADLARAAVAAEQEQRGQDLLDRVVTNLCDVGLSLQTAIELPHDAARQQIVDALNRLDHTIQQIRDHVFTQRGHN
jgi:anti-anti-sigma factor